jgi:DHA2 family multidrug resistance protein
MMSHATNPSDAAPTMTIHPYLGVAGVLLGAMITTCTGRLMSVGLADIGGSLLLGVDEASWIKYLLQCIDDVYRSVFGLSWRFTRTTSRVLLACAIVAFMVTVPTQYPRIIASSAEAK